MTFLLSLKRIAVLSMLNFMPKGSSHFVMLIAIKYGVKDLHLFVDVLNIIILQPLTQNEQNPGHFFFFNKENSPESSKEAVHFSIKNNQTLLQSLQP